MFTKLLKHEFHCVRKPLTLISIAAVIAGAVGGLVFKLIYDETLMEQTDTLLAVCVILLGGIFIALAAYSIGTQILLLYRFYKNKFSDEGYLTFTTPASTHQILLSSIVNILIWNAICFIVLLLSFTLILWPLLTDADTFRHFTDINHVFQHTEVPAGDVLLSIFSFISSLIYSLILPLLSITIGSLVAKKHKLLCAFAVGYGISMALSTLNGMINVSLYLDEMTSVVASTSVALQSALLIPSILQTVIGVGGYFLMHYLIEKHLNI